MRSSLTIKFIKIESCESMKFIPAIKCVKKRIYGFWLIAVINIINIWIKTNIIFSNLLVLHANHLRSQSPSVQRCYDFYLQNSSATSQISWKLREHIYQIQTKRFYLQDKIRKTYAVNSTFLFYIFLSLNFWSLI